MKRLSILTITLSPLALLASCGMATSGDSVQAQSTGSSGEGVQSAGDGALNMEEFASFDEPWAADFIPGTQWLFVTEQGGTAKIVDTQSRRVIEVGGTPEVDYGGQGGFGDVAFLAGDKRLYQYMRDAGLEISDLESYFSYYPDKLYKNLIETRVIYNGILA